MAFEAGGDKIAQDKYEVITDLDQIFVHLRDLAKEK